VALALDFAEWLHIGGGRDQGGRVTAFAIASASMTVSAASPNFPVTSDIKTTGRRNVFQSRRSP
jgi:hypothetical protein